MFENRKPLITCIIATVFTLAFAIQIQAQDPPQIIEIGTLAHLYEAVTFDHDLHIDVGSCADCHHHGTGAPVQDPNCARCHSNSQERAVQSCQACHPPDPFSAELIRQKEEDITRYHRDMPGLKGAYHQNCLGCHEKMGAPTDCQDCHARTEAGDAFFRTGRFAPAPGQAGDGGH